MTDEPMAPYQRIAADLAKQIRSGKLRKGDQLPRVPDIAEKYNVSRNTVMRAYQLLKDDGLIMTVRGIATYVR